jgi:hypothetical protein
MLIALRELIDEAGREIDLFELSREWKLGGKRHK